MQTIECDQEVMIEGRASVHKAPLDYEYQFQSGFLCDDSRHQIPKRFQKRNMDLSTSVGPKLVVLGGSGQSTRAKCAISICSQIGNEFLII
jgi:hypothetical protein